jgi:uncharacterized protein (TIGR04255 family)
MGRTMKRAPVYYVIAQARYNAILALESYVSQIQEEFRLLGYPDFQAASVQVINMTQIVGVAGGPARQIIQSPRYIFQDISRTAGFVLEQASLSFQTTSYEDFEQFSEVLLKGLEVVDRAAKLAFTDRVGYRYLDAIIPSDGRELTYYIGQSVSGLFGKVSANVSHAFTESLFISNDVTVTARTIIHTGPIGFPPDLMGMPLVLPERLVSGPTTHAILDTDGSWNTRDAFSIDGVRSRLVAIHAELRRAFDAIVTPEALEEWQ